ncbi:hypothetical protein B0F90DRAFT_705314 [Multifurca ochricompacta]|uniref:Uncharacterized protein n=1 Tax=Multifurca ochricompacta TaxID=376703 RepID=A0AAD4M1N7_9AGAM|nr:hypothetical protein B0F90DRAFT_705314 [Multifurca ochricompacta]
MSVDTVVDLRHRAGQLAHRLGSLSHFLSAAHELLDIIHLLSSEILLQHSRKVVTLVEISRATLSRAGIKLHLFTSCSPALLNYKTLYFDILRALRERQDVIVNNDNLKGGKHLPCGSHYYRHSHAATDRVSRLLMPLSTWLVIHRRGESPPAVPASTPSSPSIDATPSPLRRLAGSYIKSYVSPCYNDLPSARRVDAAYVIATLVVSIHPRVVFLMPHRITAPASLPHRFQQPSSTTPRGRSLSQTDQNKSSSTIRMARTRSPRQILRADPELLEEPPDVVSSSPLITQRRTQRFGIFCTSASSSGTRRRAVTVPRTGP